jgi:hypothetical protein
MKDTGFSVFSFSKTFSAGKKLHPLDNNTAIARNTVRVQIIFTTNGSLCIWVTQAKCNSIDCM